MTGDTIYALSSGQPPAGIAVVRISGPGAAPALAAVTGKRLKPRQATLTGLRDPASGDLLDRGLALWFPAPGSATGEDVAELHLHGGRSVVASVLAALGRVEGLRPAVAGEFTRRAFENGRIDLAEAEGLADLLAAETESQRRAALALAGGALSRQVDRWQARLLALSARLEAVLDFSDEGDVDEALPADWTAALKALAADLAAALARPPAERLKDGVRVAIAGPPNAGKSSLLNYLVSREAAIVTPIPGTTRDLIEAPAAIAGIPFLLIDTAGLREGADAVERIGIGRARASLAAADLILWLGPPDEAPEPERTILLAPKADLREGEVVGVDLAVSSRTGEGMDALVALLAERARTLLPAEGELSLNRRHRDSLSAALHHLDCASEQEDLIVAAEELRLARSALDRITGRSGVEDMLDALFGGFCIGK